LRATSVFLLATFFGYKDIIFSLAPYNNFLLQKWGILVCNFGEFLFAIPSYSIMQQIPWGEGIFTKAFAEDIKENAWLRDS
jgi:hypothetical protein